MSKTQQSLTNNERALCTRLKFLVSKQYDSPLAFYIPYQLYMDLVGSPPIVFIMAAEVASVWADKHIPDRHDKKYDANVRSYSERSRTKHKHKYVAC